MNKEEIQSSPNPKRSIKDFFFYLSHEGNLARCGHCIKTYVVYYFILLIPVREVEIKQL